VDPTNSNRYWLATDLGVFESVDEGDTWNPLGDGMPVAIINDIDFRESDRTLLAATYGRSMYSINVPRISTDTRNDSWISTKVLATNGQIILKAAEGNYQIEIYDRSGQFIYSENVIIGPEGRSYLNYSQSEQLKTLVVIVRKKESGESSAFKIVM
jgi:hypothetical protein